MGASLVLVKEEEEEEDEEAKAGRALRQRVHGCRRTRCAAWQRCVCSQPFPSIHVLFFFFFSLLLLKAVAPAFPTAHQTLGSSQSWLMITRQLCTLSVSPFPPLTLLVQQ